MRLIALGGITLCAACAAPNAPQLAAGAGLTRFDAEPPAGATTYERPTWQVGDRFTLLRQEVLGGAFEVVAIEDGVYRIDAGAGHQLLRDADLGSLGSVSADGAAILTRAPVDVRYHWPLWVGKTWQCEFIDYLADGRALPTLARYEVEDLDTITVPAGTFEALRIVRRTQLFRGEQRTPSQTHIVWYAPKEGLEVRQLIGSTLVELQQFERGS